MQAAPLAGDERTKANLERFRRYEIVGSGCRGIRLCDRVAFQAATMAPAMSMLRLRGGAKIKKAMKGGSQVKGGKKPNETEQVRVSPPPPHSRAAHAFLPP